MYTYITIRTSLGLIFPIAYTLTRLSASPGTLIHRAKWATNFQGFFWRTFGDFSEILGLFTALIMIKDWIQLNLRYDFQNSQCLNFFICHVKILKCKNIESSQKNRQIPKRILTMVQSIHITIHTQILCRHVIQCIIYTGRVKGLKLRLSTLWGWWVMLHLARFFLAGSCGSTFFYLR